jgi:hypothetical protein
MGGEAHGSPDNDNPIDPKNVSSNDLPHNTVHDQNLERSKAYGGNEQPLHSNTELAQRYRRYRQPKAERIFLPRALVIIPNEKLSWWKILVVFLSALVIVLILGLAITLLLYQKTRNETTEPDEEISVYQPIPPHHTAKSRSPFLA